MGRFWLILSLGLVTGLFNFCIFLEVGGAVELDFLFKSEEAFLILFLSCAGTSAPMSSCSKLIFLPVSKGSIFLRGKCREKQIFKIGQNEFLETCGVGPPI